MSVAEGDFGSDVEGPKPVLFDVGNSTDMMEEALLLCRKNLGDNATILFDYNLPYSIERIVMEQSKGQGGPWDCYPGLKYFGWEAETMVAVTIGWNVLELITRARTSLTIILVEGPAKHRYETVREFFRRAADQGKIDIVQMTEETGGIDKQDDDPATFESDSDNFSCSMWCCTF